MNIYQYISLNNGMTNKLEKHTIWAQEVRAPFKKVIAYDLLFLVLGTMIGAGIITAVLFR